MKISKLGSYINQLELTSSRLEMTEILSKLLSEASESEVEKIVYLILGSLAPKYEGVVFNVAEKMMLQVASQMSGKSVEDVKKKYKELGDIGNVTGQLKKQDTRNKIQDIEVTEVFDRLYDVAMDEGEGSQERKVKGFSNLLADLDPMSARYIARIPVGKLRLGFSDKTILDALSWMERGDKSGKKLLDRAYEVTPDVGGLAKKVKQMGIEEATKDPCPILGVPVLPMLAQRLKSPREMIEKMGAVAVEPKLDGLRVLIHYRKVKSQKSKVKSWKVRAFTRNLNETSWMFPELEEMEDEINASEVILDCEAVGVDEERKNLANFQTTMTRRRKHAISETATSVPIQFFAFDIVYKDRKNLMKEEYRKRRKILEQTIEPGKVMRIVDVQYTKDPKKIELLNKELQAEGLEGIIVKRADSKYVSGRTGWRWVKMKESEQSVAKLADTLDCVVMGYTQGRGKRTQFGIGQFLAGVRDKEKIKTITKVGTGLTDEQLVHLKKKLKSLEVSRKPKEYVVDDELEPDFWVRPSLVVELAGDEITKSPKHKSGFAVRFPRLVRFREDKSTSQATSLREINELYKLQG